MLKTGAFLQNRYEIISCIGSGGMADVYKVKDHKLNRFAAVKVLKQEFRDDKNFLSKFRVEAQSAAGLSHANIVNVYDVGEDSGINFIVMELVEGITLKTYIGKKGRLSVREATSIALQVATGLEAAHNNGIIHRDVKPQNILISVDGKAKIADFGIARAASANTINSSAMGSVHYSSPEQSRGGYSDAKSDIYSMGITIYEMVTGRVPFDGDSTVEIALRHLQDEIPSPRKYVPDLPFSTEQIILKCTQKSPDRRYRDMGELIRDLKESLVNPNGNFVEIPMVDQKAHTHLMTEDEMRQIKNGSLPAYNRSINTGAAGGLGEMGSVSGDGRPFGLGGSYYDSSSYQNIRESHAADEEELEDDFLDDLDEEEEEEIRENVPQKNERKKKRRRRGMSIRVERIVTVVSIIAAVTAGLIVLWIAGRALGLFGGGSGGTSEDQGTAQVSTSARDAVLNLGATYQGEDFSELPKGQVIWQDVSAGSKVAENTTIGYRLSAGMLEMLTVPNLEGKSEREAEEALTSMGLLFYVDTTRYSESVEAGYVITSNPGPGSSVSSGDTVTIYVSQGQDSSTVTVPDVTGKYYSDAQKALTDLGLYCFMTEEESDTVEPGLVISQDIPAFSEAATGSAVTIIVSRKKQEDALDEAAEGTWKCNAQLEAPEGYDGSQLHVRIVLLQGQTTTQLFEGYTVFPYFLNVEGVPGMSTGMLYVYTLDDNDQVTGSVAYELSFSRED